MVKLISFILPQYHPIKENDLWWGKGFTEWRNVVKVKPRFRGHYQPHVPADLGFYDLRLAESRIQQAELAKRYGIFGFCYYHYWFNGKRLLNLPIDNILESNKPDFPFCLCWANENWTRMWDGKEEEILINQNYSKEDDNNHINWLINVFKDKRYIKINGKPVFIVYRAMKFPNPFETTELWRRKVKESGFKDLYLIKVNSVEEVNPNLIGFDAAIDFNPNWLSMPLPNNRGLIYKITKKLKIERRTFVKYNLTTFYNNVYDYEDYYIKVLKKEVPNYKLYPSVMPSWDNSARREYSATIFVNSTPEKYGTWLKETIKQFKPYSKEENLIFINAFNEWAEGNHLEPDQRFGLNYLKETYNSFVVK